MSADIRDLERGLNDAAIIVCLDNPKLTSIIAELPKLFNCLVRSRNSSKHSNRGLNIKAIHS